MQIYFGENLKKLRRERDLTQEDLARCLNVAFQTVSKWERGETTPDIETLPAVARYFGVTTDALLGIDKIDENERVAEVRKLISAKSLAGDTDAVTELRRELARDFPRNDKVQLDLAMHLIGTIQGDHTRNNLDAIEIFERVLDRSTDSAVRNMAECELCHAYVNIGDVQKATELAKKLPSSLQAREHTLLGCIRRTRDVNVPHDAETADMLRAFVRVFTVELQNALITLMPPALPRTEEYDLFDEMIMHVFKIQQYVLSFPLTEPNDLTKDIHAMIYLDQTDFSRSKEYINAETYDAMQGDASVSTALSGRIFVDTLAMLIPISKEQALELIDHIPALFRNGNLHVDDVILGKLAGSDFDPIRDDPRFIAAMEELNADDRP
ncbi:MAG: helix-turn-helix domain-containing protein [Oscillospiraceae bacterium]|jgi:transcriptional regulator with XRE-family HTH domain|nr:helix-turn-helix domain-containing protein [Oscillospiraceae bacterium]